jgi:hypothetical protein
VRSSGGDVEPEFPQARRRGGQIDLGIHPRDHRRLAEGERKTALNQAIDEFLSDDLDGLVLAFDLTSADAYGLSVAGPNSTGDCPLTTTAVADARRRLPRSRFKKLER